MISFIFNGILFVALCLGLYLYFLDGGGWFKRKLLLDRIRSKINAFLGTKEE